MAMVPMVSHVDTLESISRQQQERDADKLTGAQALQAVKFHS